MCGIVGYVGHRQAAEVILDGLKRLEYRGYDSAGLVIAPQEQRGALSVVKKSGKLKVLSEALKQGPLVGTLGLGHTRWATHGKPNDVNAHPHLSEDGRLAVIHNGIIENYLSLKAKLVESGHVFSSETDTEVIVHLIEEHYARLEGDLVAAVRSALKEVSGAYALVVSHVDHELIVAARATSPMVLGLGEGENFVASDVPALLPYTREVIFLHDGDMALIAKDSLTVTDFDGRVLARPVTTIEWDAEAAEKAGFEHFMLKEIYEQPTVLQHTLGGRFAGNGTDVQLELGLDPLAVDRVVISACGTAFYSGLVGEYLIERLARLPVEVEIASEFRYREPVLDERTLCVVVSQSGETIDTLEALREAKRQGARTLAVLNAKGSSISREADDVLYIHAGPEIGVASTKAYTAMVAAFELLAIFLGRARGVLSGEAAAELIRALRALPGLVEETLGARPEIAAVAEAFKDKRDYLFLGRGANYPTALEGALKLKEISYIHAEAYATGEMKHGPIALIDADMPVVAVATASALYDKTISNLQEVRARDGVVIALASRGDEAIRAHADHVIYVPRTLELVSPIVNVVALQLLAYETAARLGRDVDQPRNLAKSVTVE
ncbi:glutamine--fructose-6-phosphate transaminase (isomerizing) [Truepera radiovictrix]|uniref:Glutamine--fructose-6-phosphate aminotransferase [isomerizing] n=1 Tax=Truepera radiovictrix (strain DSM 17093 / CIP 108686 / LMG 22925 / RQ-24) TaxID=649638 RepID=D7CWW8_TRURR|nr:glutamine--fructose-6-phosphate transaminase (isomerizing) [Truepera radiovictrix]ADI14476.1 glucosamine/fructose-6-phosphate aminotransferase, isomerizing [Truepera radiovictrix DSM 17093]WMT56969.1 glutamine--fructose-6-phosphate transaminase (isomerizing) [Truepera radiovictrix]